MSEATTALRLLALDDENLAAKLGDRFRPMHMAQLDAMPCATYETISSVPDEALDGDVNHSTDRVQFDVYAADQDEARATARRLRAVLLEAYGRLAADLATEEEPEPPTVVITGVSTAAGLRDWPPESPVDGSDDWRYRCSFDLYVSYNL